MMSKYFIGYIFSFSLLICFCSSGCVKITREDTKKTIKPIPSLNNINETALKSSYFIQGNWPRVDWWEQFQDESLAQCIRTGLANSPDLERVLSKVRVAKQFAREKKSRLFPTVFFNAEDDYQHLSKNDLYRFPPSKIPAVVNEIEFSLGMFYELDFWSKNRSIYQASLGEFRAKVVDYQWSKILLSISVAKAYYNWRFLEEKARLLREYVRDLEARQALTLKRFKFGIDNQLQNQDSMIKKLRAKSELIHAEQDSIVTLNELKALMGLGPEEKILQISTSYPTISLELPENIQLDLIARRPDLCAQIWRIYSYLDLIKAAKAAFYPNINLMANGGFFSLSYDQLFQTDSLFGSFKPALHLPIFTGGLLKANLEARRNEYESAVHAYNQMIINAAKEVANGIASMEYVIQELSIQNDLIMNLQMNLDLSTSRFKEGIIDRLELLTKKEKLIKSLIKKASLVHINNLSTLYLIKALGGGYGSEDGQ